jgi:hypothetical protein
MNIKMESRGEKAKRLLSELGVVGEQVLVSLNSHYEGIEALTHRYADKERQTFKEFDALMKLLDEINQ